jgi:hypothetical protein
MSENTTSNSKVINNIEPSQAEKTLNIVTYLNLI